MKRSASKYLFLNIKRGKYKKLKIKNNLELLQIFLYNVVKILGKKVGGGGACMKDLEKARGMSEKV